MSSPHSAARHSVPESVEAEAAAWIARLHNTERSANDERSFQRWLSENPLHKSTFEGMTDAWEAAGLLKSDVLVRQRLTPMGTAGQLFGRNARRSAPKFLALAAAVAMAAVGLVWFHDAGITTATGERRDLTLSDGSRVTLNTDTRVDVSYDESRRLVKLVRGEAFFDVARQAGRPFVVQTADSQITALGTSFSVRSERGRTQVTLVDGSVAVSSPLASRPTQEKGSGPQGILLSPGQRLTLQARLAPSIDQPGLDKAIAWRHGLIALEKMPLADAVAEMNRYSPVKLVVSPQVADSIRVSGLFHAGDSRDFAKGLADSHGLKVTYGDEEILVSVH